MLAAACSGCENGADEPADGHPNVDASADSDSAESAGSDAGDALIEAKIDVDALGDSWVVAPWNPPGCSILRANDPEAAVIALAWNDCQNGVAGCTYFDTSDLPGRPNTIGDKLGEGFGVTALGGKTLFFVGELLGESVSVLVIYDLGNGPVAAWKNDKSTSSCVFAPFSFGVQGGAALSVSHADSDGITTTVLCNRTDAISPDTGSVITIDKSVTNNNLAGLYRIQFSSQLMALEMGIDRLVYTWDFGTGKPQLVPRPANIAEDYQAIVKGEEMAFIRDSPIATARNFAVRHPSSAVETLYQKSSVWAIDLQGDGASLVWQELNQTSNVLELWTAPWAVSPGSLSPKKVRTIDGEQNLVLAAFSGEDWWVYRKDGSTLRAIRISDGKWVDAPAPSGFGWATPFGVVNGEIWARIHVSPGSISTVYSIARVPIASLGTPQS
jgi:hypothetical protein